MESPAVCDQQGARPRPPRPPPPTITTMTFQKIQDVYNKASHRAQKGLTCDEEGQNEEAINCYKRCLEHISSIQEVDCSRLESANADEIISAKELQQKMTKMKLQIEYRLQALQSVDPASNEEYIALMELDAPPSYDEIMSSDGDSMMVLGDSIANEESANRIVVANATSVFEIPDGVQIFHITVDGYVSAPSYPSSLQICKFKDHVMQNNSGTQPPAFMQVNDWIYPLIPDTSPALQTSYGAYMFPDTASEAPGAAVGLILPENVSHEMRENFERILKSLTVMEVQNVQPGMMVGEMSSPEDVLSAPPTDTQHPQPATRTSEKITKGITVASEWISWGVTKGAENAGKMIRYGSGKVQERIQPKIESSSVDPSVQKAAMYARKGTHAAVKVSSFIVSKLGAATVALGRYAAPHIRKHGERLLNKTPYFKEQSGKSKFDGVVEVAASGVKGFGTVFMGLERAAKDLARNMADETVHIVHHKYGEEAGKLTENTLYSVGNVALTTYNVDNLGLKAIAKRAAKDAGKAVIADIHEKNTSLDGKENKAIGHGDSENSMKK